jgi:hypothetical protein
MTSKSGDRHDDSPHCSHRTNEQRRVSTASPRANRVVAPGQRPASRAGGKTSSGDVGRASGGLGRPWLAGLAGGGETPGDWLVKTQGHGRFCSRAQQQPAHLLQHCSRACASESSHFLRCVAEIPRHDKPNRKRRGCAVDVLEPFRNDRRAPDTARIHPPAVALARAFTETSDFYLDSPFFTATLPSPFSILIYPSHSRPTSRTAAPSNTRSLLPHCTKPHHIAGPNHRNALRAPNAIMKIFQQSTEFDYSWEEVSTSNWRKYGPWNESCKHVIAVDTLSRAVDPSTGIVRALVLPPMFLTNGMDSSAQNASSPASKLHPSLSSPCSAAKTHPSYTRPRTSTPPSAVSPSAR